MLKHAFYTVLVLSAVTVIKMPARLLTDGIHLTGHGLEKAAGGANQVANYISDTVAKDQTAAAREMGNATAQAMAPQMEAQTNAISGLSHSVAESNSSMMSMASASQNRVIIVNGEQWVPYVNAYTYRH